MATACTTLDVWEQGKRVFTTQLFSWGLGFAFLQLFSFFLHFWPSKPKPTILLTHPQHYQKHKPNPVPCTCSTHLSPHLPCHIPHTLWVKSVPDPDLQAEAESTDLMSGKATTSPGCHPCLFCFLTPWKTSRWLINPFKSSQHRPQAISHLHSYVTQSKHLNIKEPRRTYTSDIKYSNRLLRKAVQIN